MDLLGRLTEKAKAAPKAVVYPEAVEGNILLAARKACDMGVARPVLVGGKREIEEAAAGLGIGLHGMTIATPEAGMERCLEKYAALPDALPEEAARYMLLEPLNFAALMVRTGEADAMVAGFRYTTGEVILSGQMFVGLAEGISTPSSLFLMDIPGWEGSEGSLLVFADCAICPDPGVEELADIAISTADTARSLLAWEPRVAMLSFATRGSAEHPKVEAVRQAVELVKSRRPDLLVDGEIQADAALIPEVAAKKITDGSAVGGRANVLVFPDLASANIAYKLVQRLAGAAAYGPLLQGFSRTVSDLSRGATVDDIVGLTVMSVVRAGFGAD